MGDNVDLCAILAAKSGRCSEDCAFCAQSAHHETGCDVHGMMDVDDIVAVSREIEDAEVNRFALVTSGVLITLVGIFVNMGYNIGLGWDPMHSIFGFGEYQDFQMLDFFDFISNTVLMPIVALLTCIFIGFIVKPQKFIDSVRESSDFKGAKLFSVMLRYIAPICLVLIFVFYILNTMGIVSL